MAWLITQTILPYIGLTEEVMESLEDKYDMSKKEVRHKLDEYLEVAREKSARFVEDIKDRKDRFKSNPSANNYGSPTP